MNEKVVNFPSRKRTKEKPPPPVYDDGWRSKALNARIHQIRKMVDQAPKMSPEDTLQVARNLDKILKREKTKISLGALCGDVGLGDGRDPKALYPYRNSAKENGICNRRLAKNAKKYIEIVEALAKRLNQDEKPLLKELFWKTSYDDERMREEGAEPDIVIDLLELIDGMTHWICQTLPIEEAFKLAEEHKVAYDRLRAKGQRANVYALEWLGGDVGFPRVPVFEINETYHNVPPLIQSSDGREFKIRTVRAYSLGIGPDRSGRPVPIFFSHDSTFAETLGQRYPIRGVVPEREAIEITIEAENGLEKLNVINPELPDLWDNWVGGLMGDSDIDHYNDRVTDFLTANFLELANARNEIDFGETDFEMGGVNSIELRKISADSQFADIWKENFWGQSMTITYGSGELPQLRNIIVGGYLPGDPWRDLEWVDEYVFKRNLTPSGGWPRGRPPKSDDFRMPELLWLEAHKYTQEVIGAVKLRGAIEKHEQDSLLSHFRSTPKKP